jgi:LPS export ABC transporter protein LptC
VRPRAAVLLLAVAACADRGVTPNRAALPDSADQVMEHMTTAIERNGVRVDSIQADTAWLYQARQVADLKGVHVTFFDSTGRVVSNITASTGNYQIATHRLEARGNVVAVTPSGTVLKTEHLLYDQSRDRISSDTNFTSTSPTESLSGSAFDADPTFKNIQVINPRGAQKGKGISLHGGGSGEGP